MKTGHLSVESCKAYVTCIIIMITKSKGKRKGGKGSRMTNNHPSTDHPSSVYVSSRECRLNKGLHVFRNQRKMLLNVLIMACMISPESYVIVSSCLSAVQAVCECEREIACTLWKMCECGLCSWRSLWIEPDKWTGDINKLITVARVPTQHIHQCSTHLHTLQTYYNCCGDMKCSSSDFFSSPLYKSCF